MRGAGPLSGVVEQLRAGVARTTLVDDFPQPSRTALDSRHFWYSAAELAMIRGSAVGRIMIWMKREQP